MGSCGYGPPAFFCVGRPGTGGRVRHYSAGRPRRAFGKEVGGKNCATFTVTRLLRPLFLAALLALLPLSDAAAHAVVVASTPAANGAVAGPAFELRVEFNQRIDAKRSKLTITAATGESYAVEIIEADEVNVLVGRVSDVPAGRYSLHWQVLAIDGHITRGEIPFTVSAP